ncbi:MAG: aldo/keto reductase [Anaerolineae bacterium]|nr:aldo/keto reductase [Anaerolineae bacterium]
MSEMALPRRRLGHTGFQVSILGAGGWLGLLYEPRGGGGSGLWGTTSQDQALREKAAIEAVHRAVALGINYFDTAPMYGNGEAERLLGVGLSALLPEARAGLIVSTKVGWHPERPHRYDADSVHWSLEQSLRKLFTDRLGIVHIHYPLTDEHMDEMLGRGGAVEALERLKAQGVVGAISLGVRPHRFLRRAIMSRRFDAIMTPYDYSPLRASAAPIIELAAAHDVGVINASPYIGGLLAGVDPDLAAAQRPPDLARDLERARALWQWCQARNLDLGVLAMQFSLRNEHIATTLAGPRSMAEVEANVRHATTPVPRDVWADLDAFLQSLGPWAPGGEAGVPA